MDYNTRKWAKWRVYLLWTCLTLKMDRFGRGDQPTSYINTNGCRCNCLEKIILELRITKKDGELSITNANRKIWEFSYSKLV